MEATRQEFGERSGAVRLLALGGTVGPALFVATIIAAGFLYDGYSHVSQTISELGGEGAEYALLQNMNFLVLGVLVLGFAWALVVLSREVGDTADRR